MHRVRGMEVGGHLKRELCVSCHSEKSQVQVSLTSQHALHMCMNALLVCRAVWVKPPPFPPFAYWLRKSKALCLETFVKPVFWEVFSTRELAQVLIHANVLKEK